MIAMILDMETGEVLSDGLQPSEKCDEAVRLARRMARERGESVHLVDDDGEWEVLPSGERMPIGIV